MSYSGKKGKTIFDVYHGKGGILNRKDFFLKMKEISCLQYQIRFGTRGYACPDYEPCKKLSNVSKVGSEKYFHAEPKAKCSKCRKWIQNKEEVISRIEHLRDDLFYC